jgi:methanogenic corrinoid protein MtbC1
LVAQEKTVKAVKESHPSGKVRTMVGGALVTQALPDTIGTDNGGRDATAAVPLARQLLGHA